MKNISITLFLIFVLINLTFAQSKKQVVEFNLSIEGASQVYVAGTFNNWNPEKHPMTKIGGGWVVYISLEEGYYYYKYVVDGKWIPDPANNWKVGDGADSFNSVLLVGDPPRPKRRINPNKLRKELLPIPVVEDNPDYVDLYYAAWRLAWNNIKYGNDKNGFIKEYLDEGFGGQIYQWDTAFMTAFAVYSNGLLPSIESLDNFYGKQEKDGYIQRVYNESDGSKAAARGKDEPLINPPLFAWMEWRYYIITGDKSRLRKVLPHLIKYFDWIDNHLRDDLNIGLYFNTNLGSGMDNIPRPGVGKSVWIDMSSQQALAAFYIYKISESVKRKSISRKYYEKYEYLTKLIFENCYNWKDNFFYDIKENGALSDVKHIGAYWTLLAGICPENKCGLFVNHLFNPNEFGREHLFPALSADDKMYEPKGRYWRGGVWAPTNFMVVKGLEKYNYYNSAYRAAENYISAILNVYNNPPADEDSIAFEQLFGDGYKTIWECYSPDYPRPATRWDNVYYSRQDFVGWSGLGPIAMLIEDIIGLEIRAAENTIIWHIRRKDKIGIKRLKFNGKYISLISGVNDNGSRDFEVECEKPFKLIVDWKEKRFTPKINAGITLVNISADEK